MRNVVCCMLLLGFGFGCNDEKPVLQGFRFNKNWQMSVEAGAAMVDLFTDSSGLTYAVSNYGILFSRTGNQNWKREHIDAGYAKFTSINGYGNDVYVVGSSSAIFHKKGQGAWERIPIDSPGFHLRAVHPFKNDLWVMEDY